MKSLSFVLNIGSAVFALIAAFLWWWASVKLVHSRDGRGFITVPVNGVRVDLIATLALQSKLNARAAKAAAMAALLQGLNALLPLLN